MAPWVEKLYLNWIIPFNDLMMDLPPGPRFIQMRHVINLQKGSTLLVMLALMFHFDNFSTTAWVYTALHGSYGIAWIIKDLVFPDPSWERHVTLPTAVVSMCGVVLIPYWAAGYIVISQHVQCSHAWLCFCIAWHTVGVLFAYCSDCQKYFTLRAKRGLISDGWFSRTRNPNYLGEMITYATYAFLSKHPLPYVVLAYVWALVFGSNMVRKEQSLRKKEGWAEYAARSNLLLPKLFVPAAPRRAKAN